MIWTNLSKEDLAKSGREAKELKAKRKADANAKRAAGREGAKAERLAEEAAVREAAPLPGAVADAPMVGAMQVTPATSAGAPSLLDMAASPGARPVALQPWRPAPWRLAPASAAAAPMEPGPERVPAVGADAAMARLSEPSREKAPQGVNFSVLPPPAPAPGAMERKVEVRHHALTCEAA